jgi:hypothetical protein
MMTPSLMAWTSVPLIEIRHLEESKHCLSKALKISSLGSTEGEREREREGECRKLLWI